MKPLIVNDTPVKISEKFLRDNVKKITSSLTKKKILDKDKAGREITLVFLGKLEAKRLNWQYRQKDYPTDILSFDSVTPESIGELIFCPEVLQTQAVEHKKTFEQELGLMLIHGILHLLGFDHERGEDDAKKMFAIQEDLFGELFSAKKRRSK